MKLITSLLLIIFVLQVWSADWLPASWHTLAPTDAIFNGWVDEGGKYMCLMRYDDVTAGMLLGDTRTPPPAQSVFSTQRRKPTMEKWFWHQAAINPMDRDLGLLGWRGFCEDHGVAHVSKWEWHKLLHGKEFGAGPIAQQTYRTGRRNHHDGVPVIWGEKERHATGGYIELAWSRSAKLVIVFATGDVKAAASRNSGIPMDQIAREDLPHLYHASDVLYFAWHSSSTQNYSGDLERLCFTGISDQKTLAIMARLLLQRGNWDQMEAWPAHGQHVNPSTPEGKAFLSTPTGQTVSLMLTRRKGDMGHKWVTNIHFFDGGVHRSGGLAPNIIFHIGDGPATSVLSGMPRPNPYPSAAFPVQRSLPTSSAFEGDGNVQSQQSKHDFLREHVIYV